jgi:phosphopantothenoylcysteine decarboxylase/phosphopantothenate--cysteine ligase
VLITAGPTHEPIDRVRYIGNRSSGRMGIALAEACLARAWPVTLLLGPVVGNGISPPTHPQLRLLRFQTAAELQVLLHECWPSHDLLLMAAAVADYTVANPGQGKFKRTGDRLTLELTATPDLLASLAPITLENQTVIGFALEPTATLAPDAARKLKAKRLDAIVANPLETMDATDITATLLLSDGRSVAAPPKQPKPQFAEWLLNQASILISGKARIDQRRKG